MKYATALALILMLAAPAAQAAATVAAACTPQQLTADQRAALSDIIFEGDIVSASCQCNTLAQDTDDDGPEVFCTDTYKVTKQIKGEVGAELIVKSSVMIDPDPTKTLRHGTCKSRVSDRDDRLTGKHAIFYMHLVDGFYQPVPATICQ